MLCCALQVLKEQTRRYKQRLHEAERNAAGLEQQLLAAQSANSKLKSQLQEGDAGQDAEELAQARQQAEGLSKALEVNFIHLLRALVPHQLDLAALGSTH